ncbi:PKD domain-containing protein [Haloferax sulfurifontis ATCC BAA-897]|uniref:PKD domain-containing protein n=2 Tax=Haloferax sulfurifontis TaxID=255616 RepID=M0I511_9EURY|nr:PKD domain-containing protein [Haloferax sulfurifontis ATCC BAA-897]
MLALILFLAAGTVSSQNATTGPRLEASARVSQSVVEAGDTVRISFSVENVGDSDESTAFYLLFPESNGGFPDEWEMVDRFDDGGSWTGPGAWFHKVHWDWSGLDAGESVDPWMEFTVPPSASGVYTITWELDYSGGGGTKTVQIDVREPNTKPSPEFSISPQDPKATQPITFNGSASSDRGGRIVRYRWDLDDDSEFESSGPVARHSFDAPGRYTVRLNVVDDRGADATLSQQVVVRENENPTVTMPSLSTIRESQRVQIALETVEDPDGIRSIEWDIDGDGSVDRTGEAVFLSYDTPGTYTVSVTATDAFGATTTRSREIVVVANEPPTAEFEPNETRAKELDPIRFDASATTDDGRIDAYRWDLNSDGEIDAEGESVTHAFETPGTVTVTLQVVDDLGETDSARREIRIEPNPTPTPRYDQSPAKVAVGMTVTLDASSSTDDGSIERYSWDLDGDGEPEMTGRTVTTRFNRTGRFPISLSVTDDKGATATHEGTITVRSLPRADAEVSRTSATVGDELFFDGRSSTHEDGSIAEYHWDFDGDGSFEATGATTRRSFEEPGTHVVRLQVVGPEGFTDEDTVSISVTPRPLCGQNCRIGLVTAVAVVAGLFVLWRVVEHFGFWSRRG